MMFPFALLGKHPVETNQYEIMTPTIKILRGVLGNWLEGGIPGGMVVGYSRFGKSWAIRYFKNKKLPNSNVPICSVRIPRDTFLTMNQFFELLLQEFGHADPISGTAINKYNRLVNFLQMLAEESGEFSIYIFIDDAHCLAEEHFSWLCNLYDQLYDDRKVQPCFVLFAEPSIIGRRDTFRARNRTQVIARLMSAQYVFRGIETADELRNCLSGFDERSEYPEKSGCCFSEYFLPEPFALGWRLEREAEMLFFAFKQAHEEAKAPWPFVIPMKYLIGAVKYTLLTGKEFSEVIASIPYEHWKTAVAYSNYINAGAYLSPPLKR